MKRSIFVGTGEKVLVSCDIIAISTRIFRLLIPWPEAWHAGAGR
jgi:hypothetical protein